jgi:hypothetical protein
MSASARLPWLHRPLENGDLAGVIEVVLRQTNELRIRSVGRLCHERLVETCGVEVANRTPGLEIQLV